MTNFNVRIGSNDESTVIINGKKGRYDKSVKNTHVRYGRNALSNFKKYATTRIDVLDVPDLSNLSKLPQDEFLAKLGTLDSYLAKTHNALKKLLPVNFVMKYMPAGKMDKMALMGAAYEELDKRTEVTTDEFNAFLNNEETLEGLDAEVLDINKDGKIDVSEYSTSILVSDILSADNDTVTTKNINGVITEKGHSNLLAYFNPKNSVIARETFAKLHTLFNLGQAQEKFLADKNNLVQ